jgi:hypothetical protein
MAKRLTKGERYAITRKAVLAAKARGETSPSAALKKYRQRSSRGVRTQDWYQAWNGEQQEDPEDKGGEGDQWITNVGTVWVDESGGTRTLWDSIYTPKGRRQRMPDEEALAIAIDKQRNSARRYKLRLLYAYVTSYQKG